MGHVISLLRKTVKAGISLLLTPFVLVVGLAIYISFRSFEWLIRLTRNGNSRFFATDVYSWAPLLEENWQLIRNELEGLLANIDLAPNYQDISLAQRSLSQDDKWKSILFVVHKKRVEENCRVCPETANQLSQIPDLMYAMFSVLKPGKALKPHRGPYGGVLNCHLPLRVPEQRDQCGIRVGGETAHWEEGRLLIFNDRHVHEAWNHSDEVRAVLLMYVIRPLPFPLSALNRGLIRLGTMLLASEQTSMIRKAQRAAVARNSQAT